ncbi:MAG TPA: hypothetical protein VF691_16075 [Cytophagaceae bacterium]
MRKKIDFKILQNDILDNNYYHRIRRAKTANLEEIRKRLFNGWNTEKILHLNKKLFEDSSNSFALQWAFPQAYYSTFSLTLAYFQAIGHQQLSHTSVLKQFSKLVTEGKYPDVISFYTDGPRQDFSYNNIT